MTTRIHDGETDREMTQAESVALHELREEIASRQAAEVAAIEATAAAKASAKAKLSALGLSEAEVSALLGA